MALNKEEIAEMSEYVNFQAHTRLHPSLPLCTTQKAKDEIVGSKEDLQNQFGLNIYSMAFPNGDFSERDIEFIKEADYKLAVTSDPYYNALQTDIYRLRRLSIWDHCDTNEALVRATGFWKFIQNRFKKQNYGLVKSPVA